MPFVSSGKGCVSVSGTTIMKLNPGVLYGFAMSNYGSDNLVNPGLLSGVILIESCY